MPMIVVLLSLYIIMKPFYFWTSGLPQISDLILVLAFILTFATYRRKEISKIIKSNIHFFIFLIFVIVINLLYSIYYTDLDFNLKSAYYIFDALGIIIFSIVLDKNQSSKKTLRTAFILASITQLIIFFTPLGRYYGGIRYMGTFNDPNQFAYFCLLSYSFIYLLSDREKRISITNFILLILTIFLIFQSMSTGMLLGAGIFIIFFLISLIRTFVRNLKKYIPYIFAFLIFAIPIISIFSILPTTNSYINKVASSRMFSRIEEKTTKASGEGSMSLWEERGYDRIYYYPKYIAYGAGEGQYVRFQKAYHQGELHATLPSILFCYGIIPFAFLITWGYKKLKNIKIEVACVYAALIIESFTLINSRQVLFWVIILIASKISKQVKATDEKN